MAVDHWWRMHGLVVQTRGLVMDAPPSEPVPQPDLVVQPPTVGPVPGYREPVLGRVLCHHDFGAGSELSVVEDAAAGGSVRVVFHGVALAVITGGSVLELTFQRAEDLELSPVLIAGTVMSVFLTLRGHPVLHASAVEVPVGRGLALVGHSGMGKSTMATLLCGVGARLMADDVLRTDVRDGVAWAWAGATATRLRPAAQPLGAAVAQAVDETADGRMAATLKAAVEDQVRLSAIVVPQPDRQAGEVLLEPVNGVHAVIELASFPRLLGWSDPVTAAAAHRHWGELARSVPIFRARVPWGPPFDTRSAQDLLSQLQERGVHGD